MRLPGLKMRLALLILFVETILPGVANAAAIVNVNAAWSVVFGGYLDTDFNKISNLLPTGVTVSCLGAASSISGVTGCSDFVSFSAYNASQVQKNVSFTSDGTVLITNTNPFDVPGLLHFNIDFSAFLPGSGGASVDDPIHEDASYFSSVFGFHAGDHHGCDTMVPGPDTNSPYQCSVGNPDSSGDFYDFSIPAAGTSEVFGNYEINVQASLIGIPEPFSIAMFSVGLAGATALRRRKKKAA